MNTGLNSPHDGELSLHMPLDGTIGAGNSYTTMQKDIQIAIDRARQA